MTTGRLFWGTLLITLGVVYMLYSYDVITNITGVLDLWPVLIILMGISFLKVGVLVRKVLVSASAIIIGILVIAFFSFEWIDDFHAVWQWDEEAEEYLMDGVDSTSSDGAISKVPFDIDIQKATLNLDAGVGRVILGETTDEILEVNTSRQLGKYSTDSNVDEGIMNIDMGLAIVDEKYGRDNRGTLRLHPEIPWDMNMDIGAIDLVADLSKYRVENLNIHAGVSEIYLKLGEKADITNVCIETGIAKVNILVPEASGCMIESHSGIFNSEEYSGFDFVDGQNYTRGYDKAEKKININFEGAFNRFSIKTYKMHKEIADSTGI